MPPLPSYTEDSDLVFSVIRRRNTQEREGRETGGRGEGGRVYSTDRDTLRIPVQHYCELVGSPLPVYRSLIPEGGCRSFLDSGRRMSVLRRTFSQKGRVSSEVYWYRTRLKLTSEYCLGLGLGRSIRRQLKDQGRFSTIMDSICLLIV